MQSVLIVMHHRTLLGGHTSGNPVPVIDTLFAGPGASRLCPIHPSGAPVSCGWRPDPLHARCRPSPQVAGGAEGDADPLSPAAFAPAVQLCAAAPAMAVRQLAARALAPLVPPRQLLPTLLGLLGSLPSALPVRDHNQVLRPYGARARVRRRLPPPP
jgi:hypothetical protein